MTFYRAHRDLGVCRGDAGQAPWTGYGFESFWGTKMCRRGPALRSRMGYSQYRAWPQRLSRHCADDGHSRAVASRSLIVTARDYMRIPHEGECLSRRFLHDGADVRQPERFPGSFFFRRVDPVWFFFAFAVLGLRLVARFPLKTNGRSTDQVERTCTAYIFLSSGKGFWGSMSKTRRERQRADIRDELFEVAHDLVKEAL